MLVGVHRRRGAPLCAPSGAATGPCPYPPQTSWKAKAFRYIAQAVGGLVVLLVAVTALAAAAVKPASAQPTDQLVTVRASIDRDKVTVGDRITLTIVVEHEAGVSLDALAQAATFGPFEVLAADPPQERTLEAGRLETTLVFTVAAFGTGELEVPAIVVPYTDAAGNQATATAPAIPIGVASIIPAGESPTDIRDLKPQLSVPGGAPPYVGPALIAGAVVIAVGLAMLLARVLRRRRAPTSAGPPPLPEDEARAELERIAGLELPDEGAHKEHYRLVGSCVRRYLAGRYGFPAVALTTAELEEQMVSRGVDRWQARLVSGLLEECDEVRYGQYVPAAARADADLTAAFEIVEMTRPQHREEDVAEPSGVEP
jgi:hypothetical protein